LGKPSTLGTLEKLVDVPGPIEVETATCQATALMSEEIIEIVHPYLKK
jgi:hypothetical protein